MVVFLDWWNLGIFSLGNIKLYSIASFVSLMVQIPILWTCKVAEHNSKEILSSRIFRILIDLNIKQDTNGKPYTQGWFILKKRHKKNPMYKLLGFP